MNQSLRAVVLVSVEQSKPWRFSAWIHDSRAAARTRNRGAALERWVWPYLGLAALSLVQAWEWLFSGLTKLENPAFVNGFVGYVSHTRGAFGVALRTVVMSAPMNVPRFVEASELGVGIVLLGATVALLVPSGRYKVLAIMAAGAASMVGATIAVGVQFTLGGRSPFTLGRAPFGPGVPLEALLAGISLAAAVQAGVALWMIRRKEPVARP